MSPSPKALEKEAARLRQVIAAPSDQEAAALELARVEAELAEAKEVEATQAAEQRMTGIRRAVGSLRATVDEDAERVREAITVYEAALARLRDRAAKIDGLQREAAALADRFGLEPLPSVPVVLPSLPTPTPVVRDAPARLRRPAMENCPHGVRARRTYREIEGSEGYAIIEAVGLKPWPALTPAHEREVARRAAAHAARKRAGDEMAARFGPEVRALDAIRG